MRKTSNASGQSLKGLTRSGFLTFPGGVPRDFGESPVERLPGSVTYGLPISPGNTWLDG